MEALLPIRFIKLLVLLQLDSESFYLAISGYLKEKHIEPDMKEYHKEEGKAMTPDNKIKQKNSRSVRRILK